MAHDILTTAIEVAPGVVRRMAGERAVFTGSAEDLVASGLLRRDDLPGHLGASRGMVTYHADGALIDARRVIGATTMADAAAHTQVIAREHRGATVYDVRVRLSAARLQALEKEAGKPAWPFPRSIGTKQPIAEAA